MHRILKRNLLYRVEDYGMTTLTLENRCELQNPGGKRVEVPKLEGTTTGFAHVLGRASYASISRTDEKRYQRYIYLTTFTSRSDGETLLIDWGVTDGVFKSAAAYLERRFVA